MLDRNRWERRFDTVLKALVWVTFSFALVLPVLNPELLEEAIPDNFVFAVAAALAGLYVVALTFMPARVMRQRRRLVVEGIALVGSGLTLAAIGLTGGAEFSPFLMLSLTPVIFGSFFGGPRLGLATAGLSIALLMALTPNIWGGETRAIEKVFEWSILYVLIGMTFSQARRLLVEEERRAVAYAEASEEARLRLRRLEHANDLLTRLSELADSSELNPIEVGNAALASLERVVPLKAGMVALASAQGPVVVARKGAEIQGQYKASFPLAVGAREVGLVVITSDEPLGAEERAIAEDSLQPVALAFANVQLLQDIARRAIKEERERLARELHDEIGPSLASLGLAVDLAILQNPTEPAMAGHLQELRASVGGLVEEIRSTVADLREEEHPSLTEAIQHTIKQSGDDTIDFIVKLDERRPPRPSVAADVAGIINEAVRNAVRHSAATTVTVHGVSDFDTGSVTVHDDGHGFERGTVPHGHFGLIGMEERAAKIKADLNITTGRTGTAVTVTWGDA